MSLFTHLPCNMQDAQLNNWLDLVLRHAPQVSCPQCLAAFFATKSNGSYRCPDCGLEMAVDLSRESAAKEKIHARGIVR